MRPRPSQIVPVDADVDGEKDLAIPCKDSDDVVVLLARPPGPPAYLTAATIHRGSTEFNEGRHEIALVGSAGCDMQFEYRIVVTEQ